jgi:hypothetical protein
MNSFIQRSYTKDVVLVILYILFIFYNVVWWGQEHADPSLAAFKRTIIGVGLILLIWYHVVYLKANKQK